MKQSAPASAAENGKSGGRYSFMGINMANNDKKPASEEAGSIVGIFSGY